MWQVLRAIAYVIATSRNAHATHCRHKTSDNRPKSPASGNAVDAKGGINRALACHCQAATQTTEACPCGVTLRLKKLRPGSVSPLVTAAMAQSGSGV